MQDEMRKGFPVLVSRPNWTMTWLIRIFAGAFLLSLLIILSIFPLLFAEWSIVFIAGATIYYFIWGTGLFFLSRHIKRNAENRIKRIVVDDQGIHYEKADGTTDEVLYSRIRNLNLPDTYDVQLTSQNKTYLIAVFTDTGYEKINFNNLDPALSYSLKNSRALRAGFIQRIRHFRSDLKVDPRIYGEFCIHPETFQFDPKAFWKLVMFSVAIIFGILAFAGIFLLVVLYFSGQLK